MSVVSMEPGDVTGGHVKIGAASHWGRNLAIAVAAVGLAAAAVGLSLHDRQQDAAMLSQLESFRAAYAEKCDAQGFTGAASAAAKDAYLRSSTLRDVLAKQEASLRAGAPCDEVARSLKAADYPLPAAKP